MEGLRSIPVPLAGICRFGLIPLVLLMATLGCSVNHVQTTLIDDMQLYETGRTLGSGNTEIMAGGSEGYRVKAESNVLHWRENDFSFDNFVSVRTDKNFLVSAAMGIGVSDRLDLKLNIGSYVPVINGIRLKYRVSADNSPVDISLFARAKGSIGGEEEALFWESGSSEWGNPSSWMKIKSYGGSYDLALIASHELRDRITVYVTPRVNMFDYYLRYEQREYYGDRKLRYHRWSVSPGVSMGVRAGLAQLEMTLMQDPLDESSFISLAGLSLVTSFQSEE